MDHEALARLSNLAAAKPDRARAIEDMIVQMARLGFLCFLFGTV